VLTDHLKDDRQALNLYQRFKWAVVANLSIRRWKLTSQDIEVALQSIREQEIAQSIS